MPDSTNIEQLQVQKAQESADAEKVEAVRRVLGVFDPWYVTQGQPYLALVERLQTVLHAERAGQGTPPAVPTSAPQPE